jgi:hypothetical protein
MKILLAADGSPFTQIAARHLVSHLQWFAKRPEVHVGDVAAELARYVKKNAIDLVVMSSHGHGTLANLALGSVATKCIATLEVPIMIVRRAAPGKSGSATSKAKAGATT